MRGVGGRDLIWRRAIARNSEQREIPVAVGWARVMATTECRAAIESVPRLVAAALHPISLGTGLLK